MEFIGEKIRIFPEDEMAKLKETFEKNFKAIEYLRTYYGEEERTQDFEDQVVAALGRIREHLANNNGKIKLIDIINYAGLPAGETRELEDIIIFNFQSMVAQKLLEEYPKDKIKVLDVGGGPTIYQHMIICLAAGDITHSEFLKNNQKEVEKWLNDEQDSFDWNAYFKLVKKILKNDPKFQDIITNQLKDNDEEIRSHATMINNVLNDEDITEFKVQLKKSLGKKTVSGNVFLPDLGLTDPKQYDMVTASKEGGVELLTSNFCVESATSDRFLWKKGIKNIVGKVKLNGYLALTIIRNADYYKVGEKILPATPIIEEEIEEILKENGCEILFTQVLTGFDKEDLGYDGTVLVFAKKIIKKEIR